MSIEQAAEAAGIAHETLAAAECGDRVLAESELRALADVYGIDATAIFADRVTRLADYA